MNNNNKNAYENVERLLGGKVQLQRRNGIFQARIYKGEGTRGYIWKSTKTGDVEMARQRACEFLAEIDYKKNNNIPLSTVPFSRVLDEYLAKRQEQCARGNYIKGRRQPGEQTSAANLRQMHRMGRFLREFHGKTPIERIDDAILKDYVPWRRDYYHRMSPEQRPRNHALNPAEKTLEGDTVFMMTVLKWANERGYRGEKPMPRYLYKANRTVSRPHFSRSDLAQLLRTLRARIGQTEHPPWRYMRALLLDYVLVLANSGLRVGELNNLRESDLTEFRDDRGRRLYRLAVDGKTGKREVVVRHKPPWRPHGHG